MKMEKSQTGDKVPRAHKIRVNQADVCAKLREKVFEECNRSPARSIANPNDYFTRLDAPLHTCPPDTSLCALSLARQHIYHTHASYLPQARRTASQECLLCQRCCSCFCCCHHHCRHAVTYQVLAPPPPPPPARR